jgi:hypothetical protein
MLRPYPCETLGASNMESNLKLDSTMRFHVLRDLDPRVTTLVRFSSTGTNKLQTHLLITVGAPY